MPPAEKAGERIAKVIARAGICSRRDAEKMIAAGRVAVDGTIIGSPALDVMPGQTVTVDGVKLPERERARLFRYHKPRGLVTTARDPRGRPTVFGALPAGLPRLISIGRLDINSEGLLLLTNDGALARRLELPATGWVRRYRVRVNGRVADEALAKLAAGVTVDGIRYGAVQARLDRQRHDNAWITMSLTEGKNREIRRLCEHFGWQVNRLIRIAYGPFQLGELERGAVEEVSPKVLREQLGIAQPGAAAKRREDRPRGIRAKDRPPVADRRREGGHGEDRSPPSDRSRRAAAPRRGRNHADRRRKT
jgi:23S rRNA pseudouridine2605 synthase